MTEFDKEAEEEAAGFVDLINKLSMDFDQLCIERHEAGQFEYGKFTFLQNDVVRMMVEELADTANYCRYQAIKILLLQNYLEGQMAENPLLGGADKEVTIGWKAFKGTGETGWNKS